MALKLLPILVIGLTISCNAFALENRDYNSQRSYGQYNAQDQSQSQSLQKMIEELNGLIDDAEKKRVADRYFLRDLRELARRYDNPWKSTIIDDDFNDGDFSKNPVWTVVSGEFNVDRYGLRSYTDISAASKPASTNAGKQKLGDALFGMLLDELDKKDNKQEQPTATKNSQPGEIYLPSKISNAFSIQLDLAVVRKENRIEWGVFQGKDRSDGYRLLYIGGSRPEIELYRASSRGRSTIEVKTMSKTLADGRNHSIQWNRNTYGDMTVSVDGVELFQASDRSFRSDFNGFTLINHGGEYNIRRINVNGA